MGRRRAVFFARASALLAAMASVACRDPFSPGPSGVAGSHQGGAMGVGAGGQAPQEDPSDAGALAVFDASGGQAGRSQGGGLAGEPNPTQAGAGGWQVVVPDAVRDAVPCGGAAALLPSPMPTEDCTECNPIPGYGPARVGTILAAGRAWAPDHTLYVLSERTTDSGTSLERVAFKAELDGVVVYEQVVEEGTEAPCSTAPGCESYIWTLHRDPVVTIQADFTEEGALAMAVMPGAYTGSVSVWEAGESLELVTGAALASLTLRNVPGPWVPAFLAHLDSGHIVLALESLLDFTAARIFWGQPELLVERRLSEPASYSMIGGVHVVQFDLDGLPATVWFSSYAGAGEYIVVGDCALSFTRDPDRDYAVGRRYCCLND